MPCRKDLKITLNGNLSDPLDDSKIDTVVNELKQEPLVNMVLDEMQAKITYINTLKQLSVEVTVPKVMS